MTSEAIKLERERRKSAREERYARLLYDPQVVGLLTLLGGLAIAQRMPFSDDPARNDALRGLATSGVVLLAVSRAGIGGWPALAAAAVSGAAGGGLFSGGLAGAAEKLPSDIQAALWAGIFPPMALYKKLTE